MNQHADGTLWFAPARSAVTITLYSTKPIADLTSIDRAPTSGFGSATLQALPDSATCFESRRRTACTTPASAWRTSAKDYVVFDWSYQSGPGNAELNRIGLGQIGSM